MLQELQRQMMKFNLQTGPKKPASPILQTATVNTSAEMDLTLGFEFLVLSQPSNHLATGGNN